MNQNTLSIIINLDQLGRVESYSTTETPMNSLFLRKIPLANGMSQTKCQKCFTEQTIDIFVNCNNSYDTDNFIKDEPAMMTVPEFDVLKEPFSPVVTIFEPEVINSRVDEAKPETIVVKEEPSFEVNIKDDDYSEDDDDRSNSLDQFEVKISKKRKKKKKITNDDDEASASKIPCDTCDKKFHSKHTLSRHKQICPPRPTDLICKKCGYEAGNPHKRRAHERYCSGVEKGEPKCDICNKKFCTWQYVKSHRNAVHKGVLAYCCETCGEKFKTSKQFLKHKLKHTDNPRPYECDICHKRYPIKQSVREHIYLKHLESFQGMVLCHQCNPPKRLISVGVLRLHESRQHSESRVTPCTECGKVVKTENIKAHMFRFHTPAIKKQRLFCEVLGCNYSTTGKNALNVHKYTHLDDTQKPYHCQFCSKGFSDNFKKQRHEMIHTGERPFNCEVCNKGFRSKEAMRVHMRLHTGEKPYECDICKQRFSDRGCYRNHINGHEKQLNIKLSSSIKKFDKHYSPAAIDTYNLNV